MSRTIIVLVIVVLFLSISAAPASNYTYNRTTSNTSGTADQWSAGTNWDATPVSATDTTLTFGTGALAAGTTIFTNNNFAGDFKLNQPNFNYTGNTTPNSVVTISGNRLEFINNGAITPALNLNAFNSNAPTLTISNALLLTNDFTVTGAPSATLSGVISGTGKLTKTGPVANSGGLTLSGANTFSGGVTLTRGTLFINNGGTSSTNSAIGTGTLTINDFSAIANRSGQPVTLMTNNPQIWGSTFVFSAGGGAPAINSLNLGEGAVTLTGNRELRIEGLDGVFGSTTLTVGGVISDGGNGYSLTKTEIGTLVLTGQSTYSGGTIIAGGGINAAYIGNAGAPGLGTGGITINNNSTLRYIGAGETTNKVLNYGGSFMQIDAGGTGLITFTADMTATTAGDKTLSLGGAGGTASGEIASHIFDYGPGNKTSLLLRAGTWTLSGANTYTGQTTIFGGILSVSSINSVVAGSASSNLGAPTTVADGTITFQAVSGGTPSLQYTGVGETTDRAINLVTGTNGRIEQAGTGLVKFTGNVTTPFGTLVLDGSTSGTGEFAGVITAGNVTKQGSGTWTLSGANTYSGQTSVFSFGGGKLLINGDQSGATGEVAVYTDTTGVFAKLGGTGIIGGNVHLLGGEITANDVGTVGLLTLNNNLSFEGFTICPECDRPADGITSADSITAPDAPQTITFPGKYLVDISGATSDKIVIGGALDLSTSADEIVFTGSPDGTTTYVLATYASHNGMFDLGSAPAGYELVYGANELDLVPSAVPEPGTWAAAALVLITAACMRRRRRL